MGSCCSSDGAVADDKKPKKNDRRPSQGSARGRNNPEAVMDDDEAGPRPIRSPDAPPSRKPTLPPRRGSPPTLAGHPPPSHGAGQTASDRATTPTDQADQPEPSPVHDDAATALITELKDDHTLRLEAFFTQVAPARRGTGRAVVAHAVDSAVATAEHSSEAELTNAFGSLASLTAASINSAEGVGGNGAGAGAVSARHKVHAARATLRAMFDALEMSFGVAVPEHDEATRIMANQPTSRVDDDSGAGGGGEPSPSKQQPQQQSPWSPRSDDVLSSGPASPVGATRDLGEVTKPMDPTDAAVDRAVRRLSAFFAVNDAQRTPEEARSYVQKAHDHTPSDLTFAKLWRTIARRYGQHVPELDGEEDRHWARALGHRDPSTTVAAPAPQTSTSSASASAPAVASAVPASGAAVTAGQAATEEAHQQSSPTSRDRPSGDRSSVPRQPQAELPRDAPPHPYGAPPPDFTAAVPAADRGGAGEMALRRPAHLPPHRHVMTPADTVDISAVSPLPPHPSLAVSTFATTTAGVSPSPPQHRRSGGGISEYGGGAAAAYHARQSALYSPMSPDVAPPVLPLQSAAPVIHRDAVEWPLPPLSSSYHQPQHVGLSATNQPIAYYGSNHGNSSATAAAAVMSPSLQSLTYTPPAVHPYDPTPAVEAMEHQRRREPQSALLGSMGGTQRLLGGGHSAVDRQPQSLESRSPPSLMRRTTDASAAAAATSSGVPPPPVKGRPMPVQRPHPSKEIEARSPGGGSAANGGGGNGSYRRQVPAHEAESVRQQVELLRLRQAAMDTVPSRDVADASVLGGPGVTASLDRAAVQAQNQRELADLL